MTPKEKAKELVISFSFLQYDQDKGSKIKGNPSIDLKSAVKQCALIAADEIISNIKEWDFVNGNGEHHFWHWQQVKEELEKL